MRFITLLFLLIGCASISSDDLVKNEDAVYHNPIISADFSDPDVIRVGEDYYMTASSFYVAPGLPVLHSKDMVNWSIIGHGIQHIPKARFTYSNRANDELDYDSPRFGNGVWAPSLRYHDGYFWIYWGDPDAGIYMVKTRDPATEWSQPVLVHEGSGIIDPSPLWDETTGKAYLTFAHAKSRRGINEIIDVCEMSWDGTKTIGDPVTVFDARDSTRFPADRHHKTIEGPKFIQQNDWYYILCPAGGVEPGWQAAMRAKDPLGPYEIRTICETGSTKINGPHQGGLVESYSGDWWFIHFQSTGTLGRIVRLEPAYWEDDWPVIGIDSNGDGIGNPVSSYHYPHSPEPTSVQTSDDFDSEHLGLQWQWVANPQENWFEIRNGQLILPALFNMDKPLSDIPHVLSQRFPDFSFSATTKMKLSNSQGARGGLASFGRKSFDIGVEQLEDALHISVRYNKNTLISAYTLPTDVIWLRLETEGEMPQPLKRRSSTKISDEIVNASNLQPFEYEYIERWENGLLKGRFSYSLDGEEFINLGQPFEVRSGRWTGARIGLYCLQTHNESNGYVAFDFMNIQ